MTGIAAIVLAAGASSRFRALDPSFPTKLVAVLDGAPLVRHVVAAALASRTRPVVVVTGHADVEVRTALAGMGRPDGLDLVFVHNVDFAAGLSGSLRVGLAAVPPDAAGVLVLLGDMPKIGAALIDRLIDAFETATDVDAVVPVHAGRRGNPALIGRSLFDAASKLSGDEGARLLLAQVKVVEIEIADAAVATDIDDPETLRGMKIEANLAVVR